VGLALGWLAAGWIAEGWRDGGMDGSALYAPEEPGLIKRRVLGGQAVLAGAAQD
jgi:hypothetical protein